MKNDELGKDYEEWLDEVEKTLPLAIPEEENGKSCTNSADPRSYGEIGKREKSN